MGCNNIISMLLKDCDLAPRIKVQIAFLHHFIAYIYSIFYIYSIYAVLISVSHLGKHSTKVWNPIPYSDHSCL